MTSVNSDSKKTLFVGGLSQDTTEAILHAAFIPFGDIISIQLASDPGSHNEHRGFGFIEYEEAEDCDAAIDNMHQAELLGRVLKVNKAKPQRIAAAANRAVWTEDEWLKKYANPDNKDTAEEEVHSPTGPPPPSP